MKKTAFLLLALLSLAAIAFRQMPPLPTAWDPDAGLINSYAETAVAAASSNTKDAFKVNDGDLATAWQSEAPLPDAFIKRADLNIFLDKKFILESGSYCPGCAAATDGNPGTSTLIKAKSGIRKIALPFSEKQSLLAISMKCQTNSPVEIKVLLPDGSWENCGSFLPADNFTLKRFEKKIVAARAIALTCQSDFELFEIAALAELPKESVTLDLGASMPVGTIHTRHWAGENAAVESKIFFSQDNLHWREVATLDPDAIHPFITSVTPETRARYIKVEHTLRMRDWNKVFFWEIKAYDQFGHFGKRSASQPANSSLKEMLGVNGYWSWGTDKYSDELTEKEGPKLYAAVASHARNYHDMTWDILAPGDKIDFAEMAKGKGTPAKDWVNWDREYKSWVAAGMNVQASLQFYRFEPSAWKNPQQDAFNYARAFTRHFGPKSGNGYICSIEAGNEPWKYDASTYRQILLGMAQGAQRGDPAVEVFPCALQAADPDAEKSEIFKNYMGARISKEAAPLLDGINIHAYSYVTDRKGKRRAVQPEHPHSTFWEILNAIRWRNQNMPGKKIYLSEWGWDCGGGGENCTHDECVSEQAAAVYAVRAALIANRLSLDRATWFFYANAKEPSSLYTRSGLTGSVNTGFQKKMVFHALQSLVALAGERYFLSLVREDETAWMYLLGDARGKVTHLVAWKPVDGDSTVKQLISWRTSYKVSAATLLDGKSAMGTPVKLPVNIKGEIQLELSAAPLLLTLEKE